MDIAVRNKYREKLRLYDASYYQRQHQWSLKHRYEAELKNLLSFMDIRQSERVLDVGCNTGNVVKYLKAECGCEAFGLDYPEAWLNAVRIDTAVNGDALHLPFKDGSFDKVLMLHIFGHLGDVQTAIKEAYRILKPGGKLGVITPNACYVWLMRPLNYLRIIKYNPDPTVIRYFRLSSLRSVFDGQQFKLDAIFSSGDLPNLVNFNCISRFKLADIFRERLFCVAQKTC